MRILNLVKYDFYSIFKSPLTYLAILVVSSLIATQSILMANSMDNPKHIIVYICICCSKMVIVNNWINVCC